ncbi:MAG: transcription-repair coupling factor [Spirochaetaceae bacterium]|jgi:transcription-repair coupling factor (superfamily II helicase)|nr:transcription-repair coupling factor [Spirochaetaceae bacterium]
MNSDSILHKAAASKPLGAALSAFKESRFPLELEGAEGSLPEIVAAACRRSCTYPFLVVAPTEAEAAAAASDLRSLGANAALFPWWGAMPYRPIPPGSPVFGERAHILAGLVSGRSPIVVASERALLTPLPPPEYIQSLLVRLKAGDLTDSAALGETLARLGYSRVPSAQMAGEFALRGEVLDVCVSRGSAYRIRFCFDKIEGIKRFDPLDQSGLEKAAELLIFPRKEVIWSGSRIEALRRNLGRWEEFSGKALPILEALEIRKEAAGEELFFALAFEQEQEQEQRPTLLEYLGEKGAVFYRDLERLKNAQEALEREYQNCFLKASREWAAPQPKRILLSMAGLFDRTRRRVSFLTMRGAEAEGKSRRISLGADPPRSFFGNINYLKEEFAALSAQNWNIVIAAETGAQAGRMRELLKGEPVSVEALSLSAGFALPDIKLMVVQENEIFGRRKRIPRSLKTVRSAAIDTFVELNTGDYVVHLNHGIGVFKGIERIHALGHERDYVKLAYLNEEVVFVPIEQVNLVQRYIGNEGAPPKLDKLGSKSWENRKNKVKRSVEDIAGKLIALYSKRKASRGFPFPADTDLQTMFEAAFPFEETCDQIRCVEEIKADMESPCPMDRLVCGDVGYGKTEVAVRACFKAVMGGKQAAFLAPTTILAEQHFENFQERFSRFPVRIAMLSRLVDRKDAVKTLEDLQKGAVDILVGTHRVIQKDVRFKDLGLMVIDEEQRFGVKDKERLKELKANVDCLSLSATPIPRTLHMSLLKIRDMSLLATPPQNRRPIETVVEEYNEERLVSAIRREAERGGQVFFLHNRIESLPDTRRAVERLVPEMLVDCAHGQMDPRDLEDVMHRFVHGGFHVLVSTTIIENGIDIPNVNTIIIDRADISGVSQLYQLRGRVGRSDRVAYAYLFYPRDTALSEIAMKRLQVISDFTELGSGFKIAMKDMELRGAGNLLGREQSGEMYSVGFELYLRLLDDAVRRLENESYEAESEALLDLEYSGFIPDSYIGCARDKMEFYKKIASIREKEELERVYAELLDRFGPLPDEAESLLSLAEIRIICRDLAVSSLCERQGAARITFSKVSKVKADRIIRLIQESGGAAALDHRAPNVLILKTGAIGLKEKSEFIREKLASLSPKGQPEAVSVTQGTAGRV